MTIPSRCVRLDCVAVAVAFVADPVPFATRSLSPTPLAPRCLFNLWWFELLAPRRRAPASSSSPGENELRPGVLCACVRAYVCFSRISYVSVRVRAPERASGWVSECMAYLVPISASVCSNMSNEEIYYDMHASPFKCMCKHVRRTHAHKLFMGGGGGGRGGVRVRCVRGLRAPSRRWRCSPAHRTPIINDCADILVRWGAGGRRRRTRQRVSL